jgi:hypothetical protein
LGYGVEARAVLDGIMKIYTVSQFLGVPRQQFSYLSRVGGKVRRESRERAKRLAQLRPDLVPGGIIDEDSTRASVDRLAACRS